MRVLHILNELKPSGAEVMLRLAAPFWKSKGLKLGILSIGKDIGEYAPALEKAGFQILHYPIVKASHLYRSDVCKRIGRAGEFWDVIHWHQERYAFYGALAMRKMGFYGMVRTVHSNFNFQPVIRSRIALERFLSRRFGVKHVAISQSVEANERSQFLNQSVRVQNWIDTRHYRPPTKSERLTAREQLGLKANELWLVSVGNGSDVKNYRAIIEAMPALLEAYPNLYYAQVGRPHAMQKDEEVAKHLGVKEHCRFTGSCADPRVWLWAADVFVMPSLFEGFGLAAAEALVCGIPCIFSERPGLLDWSNEDCTIHWCGTDSKSLKRAICGQLESPSASSESRCALLREKLSPEIGASKYLKLYQQLTA